MFKATLSYTRYALSALILMTALASVPALLLFGGGGSAIQGWMLDGLWETIRLLWKAPDFAAAPALSHLVVLGQSLQFELAGGK